MNYGLDNFILDPPLSQFVSILLLASIDAVGLYFINIIGVNLNGNRWLRWQLPVVGIACLSVILYPMALTRYASTDFFRPIALVLLIVGLLHVITLSKGINWQYRASYSLYKSTVVLLLIGYAVLALLPITNADSLDYHVGVALYILNNGGMPVLPEWFHSRLAGSGEVLNALGFAIGAEQFGALLQYSGLLAIAGILVYLPQSMSKKARDHDWSFFVSIAALSSPVLIFLVSSVKPQLLPIAMTTSALALLIFTFFSENNVVREDKIKLYFLICLLTMVASQMKFSYLLGGGVIGLSALWMMRSENKFFIAAIIGVLSFVVIMLPGIVWKSYNFDAGYFDSLFVPLPGDYPGVKHFEDALRSYRDSPMLFPFSLVFPNRVGNITTVIGVGIILLFLFKPRENKLSLFVFSLSVVVFVFAAILGPPTSRSYLEPFFWIMIAMSFNPYVMFYNKYGVWLRTTVFLQVLLVGSIFIYSIVTFGSGLWSVEARSDVMLKHANGYEVMQWVGSVLPEDAVLLSSHRAKGLAPRKAVSMDWFGHVNQDLSSDELKFYLDIVKDRGITHILLQGENYKDSIIYGLFEKCIVGIDGPGFAHTATRNPFNQGAQYKIWLLEVDLNNTLCQS